MFLIQTLQKQAMGQIWPEATGLLTSALLGGQQRPRKCGLENKIFRNDQPLHSNTSLSSYTEISSKVKILCVL